MYTKDIGRIKSSTCDVSNDDSDIVLDENFSITCVIVTMWDKNLKGYLTI